MAILEDAATMANAKHLGNLEELFLDPRFETLKRLQRQMNPFGMMDRVSERDHSSVIAWLLDPEQSHSLGDRFIKRMLGEAYRRCKTKGLPIAQKTLNDYQIGSLHAHSLSQALVITEANTGSQGHIDILVIDPIAELLVIIENKFGTRESGAGQLDKYQIWGKQFSNYHRLHIVLDFEQGESALANTCEDPWIGLSYDWIVQFLDEQRSNTEIPSRTRQLLADYCDYLSGDLEDWYSNHYALLLGLYEDHKHLIFNNKHELQRIVDEPYDWSLLNDGSLSQLSERLTVYRNIPVFEALLEQQELSPLAAICDSIKSGGEIEINRNGVNFVPSLFYQLLEEDEMWPVYFRLEKMKDVEEGKIGQHESVDRFSLELHFYFRSFERKPSTERIRKVTELQSKLFKAFDCSTRGVTARAPLISDISGSNEELANILVGAQKDYLLKALGFHVYYSCTHANFNGSFESIAALQLKY